MNDRILPKQERDWPTGNLCTRVPALFTTRSSVAGCLLASCFIHGVLIILASMITKQTDNLRRQDFITINLVDVSWKEETKSIQKIETPPEIKKPPPPPPKIEKPKEPKSAAKSEFVQPKPPALPAALPKEEPVKPSEAKPPPPSWMNHRFFPRAPRSKAAAAKPAPAVSLAEGTQPLCRERERRAAAEAP
jgi:hypothetical protein